MCERYRLVGLSRSKKRQNVTAKLLLQKCPQMPKGTFLKGAHERCVYSLMLVTRRFCQDTEPLRHTCTGQLRALCIEPVSDVMTVVQVLCISPVGCSWTRWRMTARLWSSTALRTTVAR